MRREKQKGKEERIGEGEALQCGSYPHLLVHGGGVNHGG
jgi:hypothetical protein